METSYSMTKELQEKRKKYVPKGVSNGNLNIAHKASGATIVDIRWNGGDRFRRSNRYPKCRT